MVVEFLSGFSRDIDKINQKSIKEKIARVILSVEQAKSLSEITGVKKLAGHKSAYRIRIGDYRLGFFFEAGIIQFARIAHRKDIYKMFP